MRKFIFVWVVGTLALGSLYARGNREMVPYYEDPAVEFPAPPQHRYMEKRGPFPPPPDFPAVPAKRPSAPWESAALPPFPVENAMALDTPPSVPPAPEFAGLSDVISSVKSDPQDIGAILELWFRKNGVSEKDIKTLSQLPTDQKALIRKIVQAYQIDMQRTTLEMRPNYQRIRNDMDALKLNLSRLILMSDASDGQSKEIKAVLEEIALKEAELSTLQGVQDKITSVFEKEMTDQIAEVVNAWIAAQASKTKVSLANLFKEAEDTYGLKWE